MIGFQLEKYFLTLVYFWKAVSTQSLCNRKDNATRKEGRLGLGL